MSSNKTSTDKSIPNRERNSNPGTKTPSSREGSSRNGGSHGNQGGSGGQGSVRIPGSQGGHGSNGNNGSQGSKSSYSNSESYASHESSGNKGGQRGLTSSMKQHSTVPPLRRTPCCAQCPCFHTYSPENFNGYPCFGDDKMYSTKQAHPPKIVCCPPGGGWNPMRTTQSELQTILYQAAQTGKKALGSGYPSGTSYSGSGYGGYPGYPYSPAQLSKKGSKAMSGVRAKKSTLPNDGTKKKSSVNTKAGQPAIKTRSHEGMDFCFNPVDDLATEVTVTIEPEEPDPLEYALDNGIMPIICGYMPPSAAPVVPEFIIPKNKSARKLFGNKNQSDGDKIGPKSGAAGSMSKPGSSDESDDSDSDSESGSSDYDSSESGSGSDESEESASSRGSGTKTTTANK